MNLGMAGSPVMPIAGAMGFNGFMPRYRRLQWLGVRDFGDQEALRPTRRKKGSAWWVRQTPTGR